MTAGIAASLLSAGTAEAVVGTPATAGKYAFAARLSIGSEATARACTAALVDDQWLATAASCFAGTPGQTVPAGQPQQPATATLSNGQTLKVIDLVPRDDRDLVLARLERSVTDITPANFATAAPVQGAQLVGAGYGRTKTEWLPDRLHQANFSVTGTSTGAFDVVGKTAADALCKGDTGAPLLNAAGEIVGVSSRSWQGGCLGTGPTETRTNAVAARVDGLAGWLDSARQRPVLVKSGQTLRSGETLASENAQLIMQDDGNLVLYHRTGGQNKGGALWASGTGGNPGAFAKMQADGNFVVYKKGSTGDEAAGALWASGTAGNASARLELQGDANLVVYTKDGGHGIGGHLWHSDTYPRGDKLASGAKLMPGHWLTNGKNVLMMDIQGNVLVRDVATSREVWGKYTWDWGSYLSMQADGNLVLYKKGTNTGALWATGTHGGDGSYATLDNNGSLNVRWKEGGPRWGSSSLVGAQSNRCLDFDGANATIYGCWGGSNQQWDYTPAKEMRLDGNLCLTAETGAPQTSRLKALTCDGRAEQKWNYDGTTIASALKPDQCVNVFSEATADGFAVGLWACGNGANAKWNRV